MGPPQLNFLTIREPKNAKKKLKKLKSDQDERIWPQVVAHDKAMNFAWSTIFFQHTKNQFNWTTNLIDVLNHIKLKLGSRYFL